MEGCSKEGSFAVSYFRRCRTTPQQRRPITIEGENRPSARERQRQDHAPAQDPCCRHHRGHPAKSCDSLHRLWGLTAGGTFGSRRSVRSTFAPVRRCGSAGPQRNKAICSEVENTLREIKTRAGSRRMTWILDLISVVRPWRLVNLRPIM